MNAGKKQNHEKGEVVQAVIRALGDCDAVGSFNYFNSRLWGSFLMKEEETQRLRAVERDNFGVNFTFLNSYGDETQIEKCPNDWAKGD